MQEMTISKMPHGGFVVHDRSRSYCDPNASGPLFAATDIADALGFIRDKLAPVQAASVPTAQYADPRSPQGEGSMIPEVELFRDKDADTITIRVRSEVATMTMTEWSKMTVNPQSARGFDFSRLAKEGGPLIPEHLLSPQEGGNERAKWPNGIDDLGPF